MIDIFVQDFLRNGMLENGQLPKKLYVERITLNICKMVGIVGKNIRKIWTIRQLSNCTIEAIENKIISRS